MDRDGILNRVVMRPHVSSPWALDELELVAEARPMVEAARRAGYLVVVATNQPDVARGNLAPHVLAAIHERISAAFHVDAIEVCPSADDADPRRKPNPGMLEQAAERLGINLEHSFFVGDGAKDVRAGQRAGVTTILLQTSYNQSARGLADHEVASLDQVLTLIGANADEP